MQTIKDEFGLQVIITSGSEAPQRALAGFALALTAASSGTQVVVWLTMHGATWALRDRGTQVDVPCFLPIAEYILLLQDAGAQIELCPTCAECTCLVGAEGEAGEDGPALRDGLRMTGAVHVAMRMTGVPTVTF